METWAPATYVGARAAEPVAPVRQYRFPLGVGLLGVSAYLFGEAAPAASVFPALRPVVTSSIAVVSTVFAAVLSDDSTIRFLGLTGVAVMASIAALLLYAAGRVLIGSIVVGASFVLGSTLHVGLLSAVLTVASAAWTGFLQPHPVAGFGATGALLFVAGAFPRLRSRFEAAGLVAAFFSAFLWPSLEGVLTIAVLGALYVAMVHGSDDPARPLRALRSALVATVDHAGAARAELPKARLETLRPLVTSTELMLRLTGAALVCLLLVSIQPSSAGWAAALVALAILACIVAASRPSTMSRWLLHLAIVSTVAAAWVVPIHGSIWIFALKQAGALIAGIVAVVTDHHLAVCGDWRPVGGGVSPRSESSNRS